MITEVALVAVSTGGLAVALSFAYHRVKHYRELYEMAEDACREAHEHIIELEREAQQRQDEFDHHKKMFDYLRDSINQMLSRPVFAQLTDSQASHFIHSVAQYLADASKEPKGMN